MGSVRLSQLATFLYLHRLSGRSRPYRYHLALLAYTPLCLFLDGQGRGIVMQDVLGATTLAFLAIATYFSPPAERRQVWALVGVATAVELFSSLLWGVYRYRLGNVPLYVPPGHGLVYLFALRWARTPGARQLGRQVNGAIVLWACLWTAAGLSLTPLRGGRLDVLGALLLPLFLRFMSTSSASLYAAVFVMTSMLELLGTGFGDWTWKASAPVIGIPVGNPPCVIAAGYCLMDRTALYLSSAVPQCAVMLRVSERIRRRGAPGLPAEPLDAGCRHELRPEPSSA